MSIMVECGRCRYRPSTTMLSFFFMVLIIAPNVTSATANVLSVSSSLVASTPSSAWSEECGVGSGLLTFELITGHVYTSPADTVTMIPGVLHLAECLDHCRANLTCKSLNFETGLCVLLSSSALQRPFALTPSQFPVFTIYAHKICLQDLNTSCVAAGWAFERVRGFELREHERFMAPNANTRVDCMQACVSERKFICRSANFEEETKECWLSDMNRHTVNINNEFRAKKYGPSSGNVDYLENNCVQEPRKLCEFKKIEGKILKTVDSVYQNVTSLDECREKCISGPYKCHSYDYGDPSNPVCRTSHLDKVALAHIENPYIEIGGATTYELQSCYDVNIICKSREMVAKVRASKIFDGKMYAKSKPHHCMTDVTESLEFEIQMSYNDLECDVKQPIRGHYTNDIVIQHHDMIVTTQDLGININCKYDLSNKSISNNVNLDIDGNLQPIGTHSAVVESPNVTMTISDGEGAAVRAAKVGDSLLLRFEISDSSSPYELFVRELVALDGTDQSEFVLIDTDGCPTDLSIMKPIERSGSSGQIVETQFEAFKFPTSDIVQFRALITPCVANCEPTKCSLSLPNGRTSQTLSYGRRRRRSVKSVRSPRPGSTPEDPNNVVVVETLRIMDKFDRSKSKKIEQDEHSEVYVDFQDNDGQADRFSRMEISYPCLNTASVVTFVVVFLIGQTILLLGWSCLWRGSPSSSLEKEIPANVTSNWSLGMLRYSNASSQHCDPNLLYKSHTGRSSSYHYA